MTSLNEPSFFSSRIVTATSAVAVLATASYAAYQIYQKYHPSKKTIESFDDQVAAIKKDEDSITPDIQQIIGKIRESIIDVKISDPKRLGVGGYTMMDASHKTDILTPEEVKRLIEFVSPKIIGKKFNAAQGWLKGLYVDLRTEGRIQVDDEDIDAMLDAVGIGSNNIVFDAPNTLTVSIDSNGVVMYIVRFGERPKGSNGWIYSRVEIPRTDDKVTVRKVIKLQDTIGAALLHHTIPEATAAIVRSDLYVRIVIVGTEEVTVAGRATTEHSIPSSVYVKLNADKKIVALRF